MRQKTDIATHRMNVPVGQFSENIEDPKRNIVIRRTQPFFSLFFILPFLRAVNLFKILYVLISKSI